MAGYCRPDALNEWLHLDGPLLDVFSVSPMLCGSSQEDSTCLVQRDDLDGLTVVATLAHELSWTCGCLEDPCRRVADSRHLCSAPSC
jgi:hypothetical protein